MLVVVNINILMIVSVMEERKYVICLDRRSNYHFYPTIWETGIFHVDRFIPVLLYMSS